MIRAVRLPHWATPDAAGRPVLRPRQAVSLWAAFWDDRQAIRLKVMLLLLSLAAAAMLETPR
jgi:hypothetical protein